MFDAGKEIEYCITHLRSLYHFTYAGRHNLVRHINATIVDDNNILPAPNIFGVALVLTITYGDACDVTSFKCPVNQQRFIATSRTDSKLPLSRFVYRATSLKYYNDIDKDKIDANLCEHKRNHNTLVDIINSNDYHNIVPHNMIIIRHYIKLIDGTATTTHWDAGGTNSHHYNENHGTLFPSYSVQQQNNNCDTIVGMSNSSHAILTVNCRIDPIAHRKNKECDTTVLIDGSDRIINTPALTQLRRKAKVNTAILSVIPTMKNKNCADINAPLAYTIKDNDISNHFPCVVFVVLREYNIGYIVFQQHQIESNGTPTAVASANTSTALPAQNILSKNSHNICDYVGYDIVKYYYHHNNILVVCLLTENNIGHNTGYANATALSASIIYLSTIIDNDALNLPPFMVTLFFKRLWLNITFSQHNIYCNAPYNDDFCTTICNIIIMVTANHNILSRFNILCPYIRITHGITLCTNTVVHVATVLINHTYEIITSGESNAISSYTGNIGLSHYTIYNILSKFFTRRLHNNKDSYDYTFIHNIPYNNKYIATHTNIYTQHNKNLLHILYNNNNSKQNKNNIFTTKTNKNSYYTTQFHPTYNNIYNNITHDDKRIVLHLMKNSSCDTLLVTTYPVTNLQVPLHSPGCLNNIYTALSDFTIIDNANNSDPPEVPPDPEPPPCY